MYLITGGSGQLGGALINLFKDQAIAPSHKSLDIIDRERVLSFVREHKPSVIINCAAYNAVDKAENEEDKCMQVNVFGTQNIVDAAREVGAYLIHISSDFVFDGKKETEYEIDDPVSPLSVYGKSKALGEKVALSYENCVVIRTAWLFSERENNFVHAVLTKAKQGVPISVVFDQIGSPTYAVDLAKTIKQLIDIHPTGLIHATNEGFCSRYEFAKEIVKLSGGDCVIKSVSSGIYNSPAQRPQHSVLSKKCLDDLGVNRLPDWHDALAMFLINNKRS